MGFDYEISYKQGKENTVSNGLSRIPHVTQLYKMMVSSASTDLLQEVQDSWKNDLTVQDLIAKLQLGQGQGRKYTWEGSLLKRKDKLVVGNDVNFKSKLITQFHDAPIGGHSGAQVTYKKLATVFYWKGMKKEVK